MSKKELDHIWKALSDPTRREILDFLRNGSKTTTEIVDHFPDFSRFGVMKHLDVLRGADLVITREDGRKRINSVNAVPIRMIYERWVSGFADLWASKLIDIKQDIEDKPRWISEIRKEKNLKWKKFSNRKNDN